MKYIWLLLLVSLCYSQSVLNGYYWRDKAVAPPAVTYLVNQNFEGTGYDNSETWTPSLADSVNADYTGVVLRGTQSLQIRPGAGQIRVFTDFTNQDSVWVFMRFRVSDATPSGNTAIIDMEVNGSTTAIYSLLITTAARIRISHNTVTATGATTTLADNTTYYVWVHFVIGTGADGISSVYIDTDATRPASPEASMTNGNGTTQMGRIRVQTGPTLGIAIFDQVLVDDVPIVNVDE